MKEFGLLGMPLGHSKSKTYFSNKFEKENIEAVYHNFEVNDINDLKNIVDNHPMLLGFNVTIPYKEVVIPILDELSDEAKSVGAVNVICVRRLSNNKLFLKGYNSDIIGFKDSFVPMLEEHHTKALVLGTGGASKAVAYVLNNCGIDFLFVSRKPKNYNEISYLEASSLLNDYFVVINTTPLGTFPSVDGIPELDYDKLSNKHYLYDLVYNPIETKFLKQGRLHESKIKNGADMFTKQAEASWTIWNQKI